MTNVQCHNDQGMTKADQRGGKETEVTPLRIGPWCLDIAWSLVIVSLVIFQTAFTEDWCGTGWRGIRS